MGRLITGLFVNLAFQQQIMEARLTLNILLSEFEIASGIKVASAEGKKYLSEEKFNLCPSDTLPVITSSKKDELSFYKWGLIPGWTTTSKSAKGITGISTDSIKNKPVLQQALSGKRCLIWCTGFFLVKESPAGKIPFYITLKTGKPFTIAGLWESWDDEANNTCCLITHDAKTFLPFFKSEMPVVLLENQRTPWLENSHEALELLGGKKDMFESLYEYYPVNRKILKSRENDPKFISRVPYLVAEQTSMFS